MSKVDDILKPVPVAPEPAPKVHAAPKLAPIPLPPPPPPPAVHEDEIPRLARAALDNINRGVPAKNEVEDDSVSALARKAIRRLEGMGGSSDSGSSGDDVQGLAKKALSKLDGSSSSSSGGESSSAYQGDDVAALARKALGKLETDGHPSDHVKELARAALKDLEGGKKGAAEGGSDGESVEDLAKRAFANVKKNGGKVPAEVQAMAR